MKEARIEDGLAVAHEEVDPLAVLPAAHHLHKVKRDLVVIGGHYG